MQTSHHSAPAIARSRPSYGPLVFGSFFLWGGVAGVLHDTTTMGFGPSLTIALSATGIAAFVVTLLPRLDSSQSGDSAGGGPADDTRLLSGLGHRFDAEGASDAVPTKTTDTTAIQDDFVVDADTDKTDKTDDGEGAPWDTDQGWASDIRW